MIAYESVDGRGQTCVRVDDASGRLVCVFYGVGKAELCATVILAEVVPALEELMRVQDARAMAAGLAAAE